MRLAPIIFVALALFGIAAPAAAKTAPLVDCPLRDAPFSVNLPMIDLLLSPEAIRLVQAETGFDVSKAPRIFMSTTTPTFAAILTLKEALGMGGKAPGDLTTLDAKLSALPVTRADKVARCARYDTEVPRFTLPKGNAPRVLMFEKINGFRDVPSVNAAHAAIVAMAARKGWSLAVTDKGGAINPATLRQFDAVIWNNISGDVLTLTQRRALKGWLEKGGGFVGMHGSAGDPVYFWDWYADSLIGARFAGHPMNPQFQEARVVVDSAHPLAEGLPAEWRMTDEWYSFRTNPRAAGARVLLTLDESTYSRKGRFGQMLDMGADHPLAWSKCIGKGRMFYTAIGHLPQTYEQPQAVRVLENAIGWAVERRPCS